MISPPHSLANTQIQEPTLNNVVHIALGWAIAHSVWRHKGFLLNFPQFLVQPLEILCKMHNVAFGFTSGQVFGQTLAKVDFRWDCAMTTFISRVVPNWVTTCGCSHLESIWFKSFLGCDMELGISHAELTPPTLFFLPIEFDDHGYNTWDMWQQTRTWQSGSNWGAHLYARDMGCKIVPRSLWRKVPPA